jgi:DNA-binding NtrC family response regulator
LEYALNMVGDREAVLPEDLPDRIQGGRERSIMPAPEAGASPIPHSLLLDEAVMALEVEWINRAMKATGNNISQAAKMLGLSRQGLHNKLAKYGIREGNTGEG